MDTHIFDDAIRIRDRILDIASKDGFVLRQWASNKKSLISDFVNYLANTCICLNLEEITFTLGMGCAFHEEQSYLRIQLHGFHDASKIAYDACIYLRSAATDEKVQIFLFCAKSCVAPVKILIILRHSWLTALPKLEA
ncbi:hypothetical protein HZH66_013401 [Vespula vulgaris]|uniref:Uncharacterized protein n=1 Tax=Vespula vulgaris TaxID=7454 RepID=A0A834MTD2_VESVU|nr:hypothetical protein HZH66_013401 [Vespula vulgaris]